jgi:hypothetical protein
MKFKKVPIEATENMAIYIINEEKYLAIGKNNMHAMFNDLEFAKLQEYVGRLFTSLSLIWKKRSPALALGQFLYKILQHWKKNAQLR